MKEAFLYEILDRNKVRCHLCNRYCTIEPRKTGYCLSRINIDGKLYSLNYGIVAAMEPTPIEDKPILRFKNGSTCLSIGSYGCNFRCEGCQNHEYSWAENELRMLFDLALDFTGDLNKWKQKCANQFRFMDPREVIDQAIQLGCTGIAFTYNEPTVWAEYVLDVARLAKKNGLYTVYVTNSWLTREHLDVIGPYIDVMALDIKSLHDEFYEKYCDAPQAVEKVLDVCEYAARRFNIHVETRTCVIPGISDDPEMLARIAKWIRDHLGESSMWHVLRFFPKHHLLHLPSTSKATLDEVVRIGQSQGLQFVGTMANKGCD